MASGEDREKNCNGRICCGHPDRYSFSVYFSQMCLATCTPLALACDKEWVTPPAVADDEEALATGLQVFVYFDLHVVEFDFYAIQQRVIVCRARCDFVQCIDHLDDVIHLPLRDDQAQIARCRVERRSDETVRNAPLRAALTADQIAKALYDDTAAQHVGETGDAFTVFMLSLNGSVKWLDTSRAKLVFSV